MNPLVKGGSLLSHEEIEYAGKVFVLESPYAGDVAENVTYAHEVARRVLVEGGIPWASHLHFPGILDDDDPEERIQGIFAGFEIGRRAADAALFAVDRGISTGMVMGALAWLNHRADKPNFSIHAISLVSATRAREGLAQIDAHVRNIATPKRFRCAFCNGYGYHTDGEEHLPKLTECDTCGGAGSVVRWIPN